MTFCRQRRLVGWGTGFEALKPPRPIDAEGVERVRNGEGFPLPHPTIGPGERRKLSQRGLGDATAETDVSLSKRRRTPLYDVVDTFVLN